MKKTSIEFLVENNEMKDVDEGCDGCVCVEWIVRVGIYIGEKEGFYELINYEMHAK